VSPVIRPADPADLDALLAIERASYPDDAWSAELMAAELANPHGHYLVAVDDAGAVAGYAGLLAPIGTGQGDIQTVTVAPHARRQGLGRALLVRLLDEAARRGAQELFLEVRHDNAPAQALYRDLGFEQIGVRRNYYGHGVDALTMRRIA
jgi:ribosomal-protein-alanine acetyltransferase